MTPTWLILGAAAVSIGWRIANRLGRGQQSRRDLPSQESPNVDRIDGGDEDDVDDVMSDTREDPWRPTTSPIPAASFADDNDDDDEIEQPITAAAPPSAPVGTLLPTGVLQVGVPPGSRAPLLGLTGVAGVVTLSRRPARATAPATDRPGASPSVDRAGRLMQIMRGHGLCSPPRQ